MNDAALRSMTSAYGRRGSLSRIGGLWAFVASGLSGPRRSRAADTPSDPPATNPIREENAKPGATDWQLTRVRPDKDGFRSPWIEGYCSKQSVKAGETIEIMVSTDPPRPFGIEIFRTGYYGGRGARLMTTLGPFEGKAQPIPRPASRTCTSAAGSRPRGSRSPATGPAASTSGGSRRWPTNAIEPYWQSYVVFIVRDDRPAESSFQCSRQHLAGVQPLAQPLLGLHPPKGDQGPWADVSFDRPYGREAQYTAIVNDPLTFGSGEFLPFEFPLAYWLEQHGYDVTYCSNSDMLTPDRGLKCKAFISVGHDEYWDIRQFRSVERMRDDGREPALPLGQHHLLGHALPRSSRRPAEPHHVPRRPLWRDNDYARRRQKEHGPFPEHGPDEGLLMGARNVEPVNGGGDWIIVKPEHWIFEGTGVKAGDRIPGLIGWEYHGDPAASPASRSSPRGPPGSGGETPQKWAATIYPGPKGELRLQRLDDLLVPGPLLAAGPHPSLVALVASARTRRPRPADHRTTCSAASQGTFERLDGMPFRRMRVIIDHESNRCGLRNGHLFAINAINFFDRQIGGVLAEPIRKEWGLLRYPGRLAGNGLYHPVCVMGVPLGRLADRVNRTRDPRRGGPFSGAS